MSRYFAQATFSDNAVLTGAENSKFPQRRGVTLRAFVSTTFISFEVKPLVWTVPYKLSDKTLMRKVRLERTTV